MTDAGELGAALSSLSGTFETLGVAWAIGGSIASAYYGEPRATNDVDVIALLDEPAARNVPSLLGSAFYADEAAAVDAVRLRRSFNVIDTRSYTKIDIFVPKPGPLGRGQLVRRRHVAVLPGVADLPILGPEDVVLQKLRWYRLSGEVSDRQWRDVVSVLTFTAPLDDTYLDRVAADGGLALLLKRARADAGTQKP